MKNISFSMLILKTLCIDFLRRYLSILVPSVDTNLSPNNNVYMISGGRKNAGVTQ